MIRVFVLLIVVTFCDGFLFGNDCNSCCPPPIPCNCVPQQPAQCSCPAAAKARSEKIVTAKPLDEMELRAQVSGLHLDQQPTFDSRVIAPRQLEVLERLGDDPRHQILIQSRRLVPPFARAYVSSSSNTRFSPPRIPTDDIFSFSVDEETPLDKFITKMVDQSTTTPEPSPETNDNVSDEDQEIKCNSQVLKKLMVEKITENSATSKRQINTEAEKIFGGNIDVVCSQGHFSYIYSSSLFCEASKGPVTCIAFRQPK